jgi:hypothetical protein
MLMCVTKSWVVPRGGTRTLTHYALDFESSVSTNSTTEGYTAIYSVLVCKIFAIWA